MVRVGAGISVAERSDGAEGIAGDDERPELPPARIVSAYAGVAAPRLDFASMLNTRTLCSRDESRTAGMRAGTLGCGGHGCMHHLIPPVEQ